EPVLPATRHRPGRVITTHRIAPGCIAPRHPVPRSPARPAPTKNEAAASICRWTASGRGDGASGTWMCRGRECAQGCAPERCTIPPVGRWPRPEPTTPTLPPPPPPPSPPSRVLLLGSCAAALPMGLAPAHRGPARVPSSSEEPASAVSDLPIVLLPLA